jgi:hypothetical protein
MTLIVANRSPSRTTSIEDEPNFYPMFSIATFTTNTQRKCFRTVLTRKVQPQTKTSTTWFNTRQLHQDRNSENLLSNKEQEETISELEPMDRPRLYQYLKLQTFSTAELEQVYQTMQQSYNGTNSTTEEVDISHIRQFLLDRMNEIEADFGQTSQEDTVEKYQYAHQEALRFRRVFPMTVQEDSNISIQDQQYENSTIQDKHGQLQSQIPLSQQQFIETITDGATSLDIKRMWPITLSILLVGTSVGIVTPAMPFVVEKVGLSPGQYGTVVSAFALAKMSANIPSAILVERHGRKVRIYVNYHGCWIEKNECIYQY